MNDGNELYSNHHLTYYDSISDILIKRNLLTFSVRNTILLKLLLLENKKIELANIRNESTKMLKHHSL